MKGTMSTTPTAKPAETVHEFGITIEQRHDFEFRVRFDKPQYPELAMDEPAPLGKDSAPNPARILAAAVGNCLAASFLFCTRRSKAELTSLRATVRTRIARNERGRLRIGGMEVEIEPTLSPAEVEKARRCLETFEDFCMVTQSVRQGFPIEVKVKGL